MVERSVVLLNWSGVIETNERYRFKCFYINKVMEFETGT